MVLTAYFSNKTNMTGPNKKEFKVALYWHFKCFFWMNRCHEASHLYQVGNLQGNCYL